MTIQIIADTSFLLECIRRRIDPIMGIEQALNSKVRLIVLKPIYEEVRRLSKGLDERSRYARLVLQLLNRVGADVLEVDSDKSVDELIEKFAFRMKLPVATNDLNLRRRLRTLGVPVIYLKGLSKIEVKGGDYLGMVRE